MNKLPFVILGVLIFAFSAESQTVLQGQVKDEKETLVGVTVKASQTGEVVRSAITDVEGNYRMLLDTGSYNIEFSYTGYQPQMFEGVEILSNKINLQDVVLTSGLELQNYAILTQCGFWLWTNGINREGTEAGQTFTADQIRHMY